MDNKSFLIFVCRNHWQIIYNCFTTFFNFSITFASSFIGPSEVILSLLLLKYLNSVIIFVSLCLPPSLILKNLFVFLFCCVFTILDFYGSKKSFFSSCVSAFSKWLLTFFSVSDTGQDTEARWCPLLKSQGPRDQEGQVLRQNDSRFTTLSIIRMVTLLQPHHLFCSLLPSSEVPPAR